MTRDFHLPPKTSRPYSNGHLINEDVKKLLSESMWDLATCSEEGPNVVPVAFKNVTDDGKLLVGDVFLETTLRNIQAKRTVPFYVKHGFSVLENGAAVQIVHAADKR